MLSTFDLLCVPKFAAAALRKANKTHAWHHGWDVPLATSSTSGEFSIYIRVNARLPESFSVGLRYSATGASTTVLVRVNGDHGPHANPDGTKMSGPHVHCPNEIELGASPRAWAHGPPGAIALSPPMALVDAWYFLCWIAHVEATAAVARSVRGVHLALSQGTLDL